MISFSMEGKDMGENIAKILADYLIKAFAVFGAGFAIGVAAIGVGFGAGFATAKAVEGISRNPEEYPRIFRTLLVGMAITESSCIYALVIALILIFSV